jgi:hypothetical protein
MGVHLIFWTRLFTLFRGDSLRWHFGYPSLLQMLAAAGNAAVAVEGSDLDNAMRIVSWEELHGLTFIGTGKKGVELALDAIEKFDRLGSVFATFIPQSC